MSYITAEDLALTIINTSEGYHGRCYAGLITAPKARAGAFRVITNKGWRAYKQRFPDSIIRTEDLNSTAVRLECYYVEHAKEL